MKRPRTRAVVTSRLTSKAQTLVPREIRDRLGLRPGDTLRYRVTRAGVLIDERPEPESDPVSNSFSDPFVEFVEWANREDDEAFSDL